MSDSSLPDDARGYGNDTGYGQQPDVSQPEDDRAAPVSPDDPDRVGGTTGTSGDARPAVAPDDPDCVGGQTDHEQADARRAAEDAA